MGISTFWGEFLGTATLILLGNGVVCNVVLQKTKGHASGWIVITAGWAFAVMAGVFVAQKFGSAAAHLNPAITIGAAFKTGDFSSVGAMVAAQMLGAIVGAALVWLAYLPHWAETRETDAKLACFCNAPAIRNTPANLMTEIIGTAILVIAASSIVAESGSGIAPFLVGALVWGIGLSLGGPTGYAINPARDLGPRIAHALLPVAGKGSSDWSYAWIPVVGPVVGAIVGSLVCAAFGV